ncbi:MAG: hypothetical protein RLZZ127_1577 [Planctomycetota bacterium]|jgi:hypothetical protein
MPRYLASAHAVDRLRERFPVLAPVAGHGLAAAQWLARCAGRAEVAAQQAGMDLLLRLDLPTVGGLARLYLPVTPHAGDTWTIRTVLTEAQAHANLEASRQRRDEAVRTAWRARKGFTRPYVRRQRPVHAAWEVAA